MKITKDYKKQPRNMQMLCGNAGMGKAKRISCCFPTGNGKEDETKQAVPAIYVKLNALLRGTRRLALPRMQIISLIRPRKL